MLYLWMIPLLMATLYCVTANPSPHFTPHPTDTTSQTIPSVLIVVHCSVFAGHAREGTLCTRQLQGDRWNRAARVHCSMYATYHTRCERKPHPKQHYNLQECSQT